MIRLRQNLRIFPPEIVSSKSALRATRPSRERAVVAQATSSVHQYLYVYLHSTSEAANSARTPISMNVLKEIDEGTEAMRKSRPEDARKHLLKAAQRAPQNADVQYLLGQLESSQNKMDAARARYEQAIALSPTHEHALVALGELQLREQQCGGCEYDTRKSRTGKYHVVSRALFSGKRVSATAEIRERQATCAKRHRTQRRTSCPWGMRC